MFRFLSMIILLFGFRLSALQAQTTTEPSAPIPSAAVQKLLAEVDVASKAGKQVEALSAVDRALSAAQEAKDAVGEAMAEAGRARSLAALKREPEAVAAWNRAAEVWEGLGDGPGRVEALVQASALLITTNPAEAKRLREEALARTKAETRRPLAAAKSLHVGGKAYYDCGRLGDAEALWLVTLDIRERLDPNSLEMAKSLNNLGVVALELGDLKMAQDYHQRALSIREKLAPNTDDLASSFLNLGSVAFSLRDFSRAKDFFQRALTIEEKLSPNSLDVAKCLSSLGYATCQSGDISAAQDYCLLAQEIFEKLAPDSIEMAKSLNILGSVASSLNDLRMARDSYLRALKIGQKKAPHSLEVATTFNGLGLVAKANGDLPAAQNYYQRALAIYQKIAPNSLYVTSIICNLGGVEFSRGNLSSAQDYFQSALAIQAKLSPNSRDTATILDNLGNVAYYRGDLPAAQDYHQQAQALYKSLAPHSLDSAMCLIGLGNVEFSRCNLSSAQDYFHSALVIQEKLSPNSLDVAKSLTNLGFVAYSRGDLPAAQDYHQQAQALYKRLAPHSLDRAASLIGLGNVAYSRGSLSSAQNNFHSALAIYQKLALNSLDMAACLNNLGTVAREHHELSKAQEYHQRALLIYRKLAFNSLDTAASLIGLGNSSHDLGDLLAAQGYFRAALTIQEKLATNSLDMAKSLHNLGSVAYALHDLQATQDDCQRALTIYQKLAPNSLDAVEILIMLSGIARLQHHTHDSLDLLNQSDRIMESQRAQILTSDQLALLVQQYANLFTERITNYLDRNDLQNAFVVLEESRARSLLEMLEGHRNQIAEKALPKTLRERQEKIDSDLTNAQRERNLLLKERSLHQTKDPIADLSANDERLKTNELRLKGLSMLQSQIDREIAQKAPDYAALVSPKRLDFRTAQHALDPGTLLLEFKVDRNRTLLFTLTDRSIKVYPLPIKADDLRKRIDVFHRLIGNQNLQYGYAPLAKRLYDLLLGRAQKEIGHAKRLLISPDGPLNQLPFAALVTSMRGDHFTFLIEAKRPLHFVVSLKVYSLLRRLDASRSHKVLAVSVPIPKKLYRNGDTGPATPQFWGESRWSNADPIRQTSRRIFRTHSKTVHGYPRRYIASGQSLSTTSGIQPLTCADDQVDLLGRLYGSLAHIYSDRPPHRPGTPSVVFREGQGARILHFACHGLLCSTDPLLSALALDPDGPKSDGRLYGYDILARLHLRADLVVLAACQTGLGDEIRGEGIVGLTRAFQQAGAKSVIASLWSVEDARTARLMEAFYKAWKPGRVEKDEALRKAQLSLLSTPQYRHPFYWSAFQLYGDWK